MLASHSCCTATLLSLSLQSGVVMEFRLLNSCPSISIFRWR